MGLLLLRCSAVWLLWLETEGIGERARLECGPLESGDATVLPHNVRLLQLELERGTRG